MWSLKPYKSPPSQCPVCDHQNNGFASYFFAGSQILSQGECTKCGATYFHNWPIGHGEDFPMSFSNGSARYPLKAEPWLAKPIIKAVKEQQINIAKVRREERFKISRALVLNCLDPCFGHILLKLFNTSYFRHLKPPEGLVVIIPENCTWLVPDYVAEIWAVDTQLQLINSQFDSLKSFIDEISKQFDSIQVLPVRTHLDHSDIDLYQYLRVRPFRLADFGSKPPQVCFIWREDRWWLRTRIEKFLSSFTIKYSFDWLRGWFLRRQLNSIAQVAELLRQEIPEVSVKIIGLGRWGAFPYYFEDLRKPRLSEEEEIEWCRVYADSHVIVGVHGSNMLIPTALAAGFIELLPEGKIPFISEDILMNHPPRFQTFLGRHLDLNSTPGTVAKHLVSILKDFQYLYKNTTAKP